MMGKTKTSTAAKNRYNAKAYDQLPIRVAKGRKEAIQAAAESAGQSLNGYVTQAIDERMERDSAATEDGEEDTGP